MKVSLNWVKQFTDVDISVFELVEKIGTQLGAVEEVIDLGKKYQGVVVAKVVGCEKHPNADKLSVCAIDDGGVTPDIERDEKGYVQVVCGAPNVRSGLTVAWLPPGSTVPSTFDIDPFVLGARELRGVVSNGMLASASELAISDDHSGIVELDIEAAPGSSFAEVYQLDDYIIDIENKMFTHRPDCFGILGVAREIAGIQHKPFNSPEWYTQALGRVKPGRKKLDLQVTNDITDVVPRFMAIAMTDITVKHSPFTIQTYLSRVGLRPINNMVDITNYIMYLTGQPTHAYDADKLEKYGKLSLETRMSRKGDKINLLNGKTVELQDDSTILITSNDVPVGIAGCMGGADTEVDETTKNIVIECANFDMYSIRRSSMKYGLFTDAVTRFNKGQSALQNERVLEETVAMVQSMAGGDVASEVRDVHKNLQKLATVTVGTSFINDRLGVQLTSSEIVSLLQNVEFGVELKGESLLITAPFWRTDIEIPEDIVEEVGRLYGLDQLPLSLPLRSLAAVEPNGMLQLKTKLRNTLASAGANEVLTYGFVHGDMLQKVGQDISAAFRLTNALSPELQYYRLSITPSLLEKVHPNIKAGFGEFALYELGKVHSKTEIAEDGLPKEFERLSFVLAKEAKSVQQGQSSAFYQAKYYAEYVLGLQTQQLRYVQLNEADTLNHKLFEQMLAPFEPARAAVMYAGDTLLGVVGEYKSSVAKALKLPQYCAGFELFLGPIAKVHADVRSYTAISRFPKVQQDITLKVPSDVSYQEVEKSMFIQLAARKNTFVSLSPISIYQKDTDSDSRQISFRLTISSYDKTLIAEEVNTILDDVASKLATKLNTERV